MRRIVLLLAVVALTALTGCIDYEEVLTLNADGSGSVKMHVTMDKQYMKEMEALAAQYGMESEDEAEPEEEICTEEEMRAALKAMNSGIELVSYKHIENDSVLDYEFEFKFADYEDFQDLQNVCGEADPDAPQDTDWDFSYDRQSDGSWLYQRFTNGRDVTEEEAWSGEEAMTEAEAEADVFDNEADTEIEDVEEIDPEELAEAMRNLGEAMQEMVPDEGEGADRDEDEPDLAAAMEGLALGMQRMQEDAKNHTIRYTVIFPGAVSESNATNVSENTATWEFTLDQMENAPDVLRATVKP